MGFRTVLGTPIPNDYPFCHDPSSEILCWPGNGHGVDRDATLSELFCFFYFHRESQSKPCSRAHAAGGGSPPGPKFGDVGFRCVAGVAALAGNSGVVVARQPGDVVSCHGTVAGVGSRPGTRSGV
uniref:Uncharacterized protein n=1 Tax=Romanomermis culicivorax TaxID=13658 RepID=A0A915JME9_ROMCU